MDRVRMTFKRNSFTRCNRSMSEIEPITTENPVSRLFAELQMNQFEFRHFRGSLNPATLRRTLEHSDNSLLPE